MLNINPYIFFSIASLIFILIISKVYFNNNEIKNKENRIYTKLLITIIISLVLEIMSTVLIAENFFLPLKLLRKSFMIATLLWSFYFLEYSIMICKKNNKKISLLFKLSFIITSFSILISPLYFNLTNNIFINSYGPSQTIFKIAMLLICFIVNLIFLLNIPKVNKNKEIYIILFNFLITLEEFIQIIYPNILLINFILSIVTSLIYFTLENPDLKLITKLNLAIKETEKANKAKSEFLSSMSHEIRTPLNSIVGFSECIKNENDIDKIKEEADDIIKSSQNLLDIINGILDISTIEAGQVEIHEKDYNLKEELLNLIKLIKSRISNKDLKIELNISDDIPNILHGDIDKIKTIITHFLTNAIKYTEHGTISLNVNSINYKDYSKLIIAVQDTGKGIKKENINKIFFQFQRLEKDINSSITGVGLGLAIAKSLTEILGGKLEVKSIYQKGSTFTITLKQTIIKLTENIPIKEINCDLNKFKNKKILVVDDNQLNLKVATRILNNYNITPDTCNSGIECLQKLKTNTYDLIFMDDMMPEMSGVETLAKLKAKNNFNTPVVTLTANAISGMQEYYLSKGFTAYLAKPINRQELLKVLSTYLK